MAEALDMEALALEFDGHTKNGLLDFWVKPLIHFAVSSSKSKWGNLTTGQITEIAGKGKNPTKDSLVVLCARAFSNRTFLQDYYESFSAFDKQIIYAATWNDIVTAQQLEEICGEKFWWPSTDPKNHDLTLYYGRLKISLAKSLRPWAKFMVSEQNYYSLPYNSNGPDYEKAVKLRLEFPLLLRRIYATVIPKPKGYFLEPISLPPDSISFSFERKIFEDLPLLTAYYAHGNVTYTQKGAPNSASVKKMQKVLELAQFPGTETTGNRSILMAGLFSNSFKISATPEEPLAVLKRLFNPLRTRQENLPFPPFVLSHLKGIRNIESYEFSREVTESIFNQASQMPADQWFTKENLIAAMKTKFVNLNILSPHNLTKITSPFSGRTLGYGITQQDIWNHVNLPNVLGHFYLFAAFGLMEIAVDPKLELQYSYYDDLIACKLTKLGAYVFGATDKYEAPEHEGGVSLTLDEDNLIVKADGNSALAEVLLKDYLQKISENRFQLHPEFFLKDCNNPASLKKKIQAFKSVINKPLPAFWENYLEELVQKSDVFRAENDFFIFKLPENDKELIKIIVQDPELKKILIKAEQFFVMVRKSEKSQFISRMKFHGYIVNV